MGYDYTENDIITGGQAASDPAAAFDNFEVAGVTMAHDADEIEVARARREPPPGDHEFFVQGFWKAPEYKSRSGYVNGQAVSWGCYTLGVRLAMVSDPAATVLDFFDLPPAVPFEQSHYLNATSKADGKNAGFMAEKFGHFISRLGWPTPKGQPMPEDARKPKNWIGRRIVATIEYQAQKGADGQPKMNPATGEPYPPRAQVKLFSYKPSMSQPIASMGGAAPVATAPTTQANPAAPTPAPTPTPTASHDRLASLANQL